MEIKTILRLIIIRVMSVVKCESGKELRNEKRDSRIRKEDGKHGDRDQQGKKRNLGESLT